MIINWNRINIKIFLFIIVFPIVGQAQKCPSPPPYDSLFKRNVYSFVEEQPEYAEGTAELVNYILKNLVIKTDEKEGYPIGGNAFVYFIVEADGTIKDVIPRRNDLYYMDIFVARVIKGMSGWKPGKCNGESVAVKFSLPISCIKLG